MTSDTAEEKDFRDRYAHELRKKKVRRALNPHFGIDELADELERISHQELITPGRRGEQIKREEINNEMLRRKLTESSPSDSNDEGK